MLFFHGSLSIISTIILLREQFKNICHICYAKKENTSY